MYLPTYLLRYINTWAVVQTYLLGYSADESPTAIVLLFCSSKTDWSDCLNYYRHLPRGPECVTGSRKKFLEGNGRSKEKVTPPPTIVLTARRAIPKYSSTLHTLLCDCRMGDVLFLVASSRLTVPWYLSRPLCWMLTHSNVQSRGGGCYGARMAVIRATLLVLLCLICLSAVTITPPPFSTQRCVP